VLHAENVVSCCISKGGYKNDSTCPPPCETEGPDKWWSCCETRFKDKIPDDTCPPKECGLLNPQGRLAGLLEPVAARSQQLHGE
jgi:hypothetical protein